MNTRLVADRGVRIGSTSFGLGWVLAGVAVNVVKTLGFRIVGLHVAVGDGPRRGNAAVVVNLAEVFLPQTKQRRAEEFRVAADVVIGVRVELIAVFIVPLFFSLVFPFEVHRARVPVVFFPRHVATAFNEQNFLPGRGELVSQGAAASAATDNDDVIMIVSCHFRALPNRQSRPWLLSAGSTRCFFRRSVRCAVPAKRCNLAEH